MADEDQHIAREVYAAPPAGDWKKYVKPTVGALIALVIIVFVASNWTDVTVSFVVFSVQMKLFWALVISVALGLLLGEALRWWLRRRKRRMNVDG